jgi:ABC-type uncharacterized transport system permease subunit
MTLTLATLAILLYSGSATLMAVRAWQGQAYAPTKKLLIAVGVAALACHLGVIVNVSFVNGGIAFGLTQVACTISWVVALIGLIGSVRAPADKLLIPIYSIAALALAALLLFPGSTESRTISAGLGAHILLSLLAYSMMTVGACQAAILALQNHQLRTRHTGGLLNSLPPLQTMEQWLFTILWVGMLLLTLSILSGVLFLDDIFAQHVAHKSFFSIIAWLIFALLLWGRHRLGWRGQTAIRWTLLGFSILMLSYLGSKFVRELILQSL